MKKTIIPTKVESKQQDQHGNNAYYVSFEGGGAFYACKPGNEWIEEGVSVEVDLLDFQGKKGPYQRIKKFQDEQYQDKPKFSGKDNDLIVRQVAAKAGVEFHRERTGSTIQDAMASAQVVYDWINKNFTVDKVAPAPPPPEEDNLPF